VIVHGSGLKRHQKRQLVGGGRVRVAGGGEGEIRWIRRREVKATALHKGDGFTRITSTPTFQILDNLLPQALPKGIFARLRRAKL
jgi:hypothetical protein